MDKSDLNGNKIFHLLVVRSLLKSGEEKCAIDNYHHLISILSSTVICSLLKEENDAGLRQLELATNSGVLGLMKAMLLTRDMYVIREENKGWRIYQWIDVTEYENFGKNSRKVKSPIFSLVLLDRSRLACESTKYFFKDQIFPRWFQHKLRCNTLPAILFVLLRLAFMVAFIIIDSDVRYYTKKDGYRPATTIDGGTNNTSNLITSCSNFTGIFLTSTIRHSLH